MKILVADDSKTNLAITTSSLEKLGHLVIPVTSGELAVQAFKNNPPDLVILDVVMDGMNGFETAKKLRTINIKNWIPIIFLSANVDDESIKQGIDAGGDDYLTKPFSEITLAAKIKAMQRISDMRQTLILTSHELEKLSATDPLTGLYNRFQFDRSFEERLALCDRHEHTLGLMFIDLDNFKLINDTFGHHVGDLLLKEVSHRLKSCLRKEDFIARIGGDEFSVIIHEIDAIDETGLVAQKILDALSIDFFLDGHNIRIGASIGIASYPDKGTSKENVMKHADIAMYQAKSLGRNTYQYFTQELNEKYKEQLNLEYSLRFALDRNEMFLTYQPIINLQTNEVVGLETLLVWDHPRLGIISPSLFIPIAEEAGLISMIGNWVIRSACEQAKKWDLNNTKNFKLAINLSSHQLLQDNFFEMVVDVLKTTQISPQLLELELTETTVMSYRTDVFKDALKKLESLGMTIAIDDFGTGYSSLTRLKHLSIKTLKIDKTFIQDILTDENCSIIVSCLIALGNNLGLKVIAEGIENEKQLEFLVQNGCLYGQGYLLSRPLYPDKVNAFLKTKLIRSA